MTRERRTDIFRRSFEAMEGTMDKTKRHPSPSILKLEYQKGQQVFTTYGNRWSLIWQLLFWSRRV